MKRILFLLLLFLPFIASAQVTRMGGIASRVTDSTTYITSTAVTSAHTAGYSDIWYSDSSGLWWVWNGSSYDNWDPTASGSGGIGISQVMDSITNAVDTLDATYWKTKGTSIITQNTTINGSGRNLDVYADTAAFYGLNNVYVGGNTGIIELSQVSFRGDGQNGTFRNSTSNPAHYFQLYVGTDTVSYPYLRLTTNRLLITSAQDNPNTSKLDLTKGRFILLSDSLSSTGSIINGGPDTLSFEADNLKFVNDLPQLDSANWLVGRAFSDGRLVKVDKSTISGSGSGDVSKVGTPANNQVGVWTGDGTIEGTSGLTYDGSALAITGNITLSGTVDGIDIATDVAANTAKVSNATHTGDVTGSTTLTIAAGAVDQAMTSITGTPTGSKYLRDDWSWQTVSGLGFTSGSNSLTAHTDWTGNYNWQMGTSGSRLALIYGYATNSIYFNTLSTLLLESSSGTSITTGDQIALLPDSAVGFSVSDGFPVANRTDKSYLASFDVESSAELFAQSENGAAVNLTGLLTPKEESGTSFTLDETHRSKGTFTSNGSAVTVTVDENLTLGGVYVIMQDGAGIVTLSEGTDVNIRGKTATTGAGDFIWLWLYKKTGGESYFEGR